MRRPQSLVCAALLLACAAQRLLAAQLLLRPMALGAVSGPTVILQPLSIPAAPASLLTSPGLSLSAPELMPTATVPTVSVILAGNPAAAEPPAAKLAVMSAGVQTVTEGLANMPAPSATDVHQAGDQVEDLMTRGSQSPAQPVAGPSPASQEELTFTAQASAGLASAAEDWGAEHGRKFSRMGGQEFLEMLDAGMARYAQQNQAKAPSPQAYAAALTVQTQLVRLVKAMLKPGEPLDGQIRRILSVWNVYNQAMQEAAEKGSTQAIEDEARLFAQQVEQSV